MFLFSRVIKQQQRCCRCVPCAMDTKHQGLITVASVDGKKLTYCINMLRTSVKNTSGGLGESRFM